MRIFIKISLNFVAKDPIDSKPALVRMCGAKSLPEPMMTQFIDAYVRHKEEMS